MGSLRRGLSIGLCLSPAPALAEVCDKERPHWNTESQAAWLSEALHLFLSPLGIFVAVLFIIALLTRKTWLNWTSLAVTCLVLIALLINPALPDPTGLRYFAVMEGCISSQNLSFLLLVAFAFTSAICARRGTRRQSTPNKRDEYS